MEDSPKAPAGWYPVSSGGMRYWDGTTWTDYTSENYWIQQQAKGISGEPAPLQGAHGARDRTSARLHRKWQTWAVVAALGIAGLSTLGDPEEITASTTATAARTPVVTEPTTPAPTPSPSDTSSQTRTPSSKAAAPLFITDQKDGDSFVASDGNEYRLGLVNTAEANEPCGPAATRFTREFLASGFTVDAYARDSYGRRVAEVFDTSGKSLNVSLARSGYGDDRYLNQFRHENPDLARRLEAAFASAASPSCLNTAPAPLLQQPKPSEAPDANCMTGYDPCLPIRGDLNCPDIGHPVSVTGSDPYGLDRDGDGIGCD